MANPAANQAQQLLPGRVLWIDYLRSFITLLVIAHHSSLAYTTFANADPVAYIRSTAPIVDTHRWVGLDIFENFNDVFFMSLMFLIGGVFVVKSLEKKGIFPFIRDRLLRLFLPFLIVICTFTPLAYFPAYLNMYPQGNVSSFLNDFLNQEGWPPGPPWFIAVLFMFNLIVAIFSRPLVPRLLKGGNRLATFANKPLTLVIVFYVMIWLLYVPLSWLFGPYTWTGFGPIVFQKCRLLMYFFFFIAGCLLGNNSGERGLLSGNSLFVKRWALWLSGCIIFYLLLISLEFFFPHGESIAGLGRWPSKILYSSVYALSICFSSIALLTIFRKFAIRSKKVWNSLSANAYCMYLVHYVYVLWLQYCLLNTELPAWVKFLLVFLGSVVFSWLVSIYLRKIPLIKKYI